MADKKAVRLMLYGIVQGVGMRFYVSNTAKRVGVSGFVRNLPDGSVEIVAEGTPHEVDAFIDKVKNAPRGRITDTKLEDVPVKGSYNGFQVRF
ncbi:MAG: acylphosphatase [Bacillota bacterium]